MARKLLQTSVLVAIFALQIVWQTEKSPCEAMDYDEDKYTEFVRKHHIKNKYGHSNATVSEAETDYNWVPESSLNTFGGQHHHFPQACAKCWSDFNPNYHPKNHHDKKDDHSRNQHDKKHHDKKGKK